MTDLIIAFLFALLASINPAADPQPSPAVTAPAEEIILIAPYIPEPPSEPCVTDAECYAAHPDVPEPGHDESDCIVVEDGSCVPPSFFADAPVPSVSEGLGSLGYLPCQQEDGPGPCFWDAAVRGNGEGRSFVVDSLGGVIYLEAS